MVAQLGGAGVSPTPWYPPTAGGGTWKWGSIHVPAGRPAQGVKAAPSTHLKDTNSSKVSGSIAQALLTRHGSRWQGVDGAVPAPESHKNLPANPYGVRSQPVTCGGRAEGPGCGTPG